MPCGSSPPSCYDYAFVTLDVFPLVILWDVFSGPELKFSA